MSKGATEMIYACKSACLGDFGNGEMIFGEKCARMMDTELKQILLWRDAVICLEKSAEVDLAEMCFFCESSTGEIWV